MTSTDWLVISESDLASDKATGGFIRAYCHIHGSDKQRSLSINAENGFGSCHACGAQVLVRELNPEAAANIARGQGRIDAGDIQVRDPKYIARAARAPKQPAPRTIEKWQREEIDLLRSLYDSMTAHLADERASAYIKGRGLSFETAAAAGLGYIPDVPLTGKYARIARWADHIIIPVHSPSEGLQFAGRCLRHWRPGMDENEHKDLLKEKGIERWRKTHAGGWFNLSALKTASHVIVVEGVFDCLALMEAGQLDTLAIVGTALDVSWLPKGLEHVTLAFDADKKGIEKGDTARAALYLKGYDVTACYAPQDDKGKDWSERYRLHGEQGLSILIERQEDEPFLCSVCGLDLNNPDIDANIDNEGLAFCSEHWVEPEPVVSSHSVPIEPGEPAPFSTQEQFAEQARGLVESIFGPCETSARGNHDQRIVQLGLKVKNPGVRCSACRFNPAVMYWREGRPFCQACRDAALCKDKGLSTKPDDCAIIPVAIAPGAASTSDAKGSTAPPTGRDEPK